MCSMDKVKWSCFLKHFSVCLFVLWPVWNILNNLLSVSYCVCSIDGYINAGHPIKINLVTLMCAISLHLKNGRVKPWSWEKNNKKKTTQLYFRDTALNGLVDLVYCKILHSTLSWPFTTENWINLMLTFTFIKKTFTFSLWIEILWNIIIESVDLSVLVAILFTVKALLLHNKQSELFYKDLNSLLLHK